MSSTCRISPCRERWPSTTWRRPPGPTTSGWTSPHRSSTPPTTTAESWLSTSHDPADVPRLVAAVEQGADLALGSRYVQGGGTTNWGVGRRFVSSGGSLYAIDMLNGLYQLRFAGGALSVVSGGGNVPERYSSDLWVNGEYAYTGTWGVTPRNGAVGNAVKIWHLDQTGAPALVDSIITDSIATVSDVKGSADGRVLVFSAELGAHAGLYVYSLANPVHPSLVAKAIVPVGFHTAKLAAIGGRQYVFAARNPGNPPTPALVIYDVTDLLPPP